MVAMACLLHLFFVRIGWLPSRAFGGTTMGKILKLILLSSVLTVAPVSLAQEKMDYMPSLITKTPLEGRMLAIKIVRKTIGAIQRSSEIKAKVRQDYQDDAELLMRAAGLVAIEFKTIAIANNYWR